MPQQQTNTAATWEPLVARIRAGEENGTSELYKKFEKQVRLYLLRRVGRQEAPDQLQDVMLSVVRVIMTDALQDPGALMGYALKIAQRTAYQHIIESRLDRVPVTDEEAERDVIADPHPNQEAAVITDQQYRIAMAAMQDMPARSRNVLVRSLLMEQPPEQICAELEMSVDLVYAIKCRGRQRLAKLYAAKLQPESEPTTRRRPHSRAASVKLRKHAQVNSPISR